MQISIAILISIHFFFFTFHDDRLDVVGQIISVLTSTMMMTISSAFIIIHF